MNKLKTIVLKIICLFFDILTRVIASSKTYTTNQMLGGGSELSLILILYVV